MRKYIWRGCQVILPYQLVVSNEKLSQTLLYQGRSQPSEWNTFHRQWPKSMNYMYIQCSTKWFILGQNHPGFSWHIVKCLICVFPMLLQCKYQENIVKCARKVPARKWQCYIFQRFCSLKVNKNTNIKCEIKRYGIKIYLKCICHENIVRNEV